MGVQCDCGHGTVVHTDGGCLGMIQRDGQARNKWRCKCARKFYALPIVTAAPLYDIVGVK